MLTSAARSVACFGLLTAVSVSAQTASESRSVAWDRTGYVVPLPSRAAEPAQAVVLGSDVAISLRTDGRLAAWGESYAGLTDVPQGADFIGVSVGEEHALAVRRNGTVVAWGVGNYGQETSPLA